MPNTLINRLVLNLHDYAEPLHPSFLTQTEMISDIAFHPAESRILGNIGAPLDHGQWDDSFGWVESELELDSEDVALSRETTQTA